MSFASFIAALKSSLSTAGLTETADPREESLLTSSRGNFDGSYLLALESSDPWPEAASLTPSHWKGVLRLEIATALTTSVIAQSETVETRGRAFFEQCVYTDLAEGDIYGWDPPQVLRNFKDKRIVWQIRLQVRWTE